MATIRELRANFTARVDGMRNGLDQVRTDMERLRRQTEDTTRVIQQRFGTAGTAMRDAGKKLEAVGGVMKTAGKNMSMYVTAPLVGIGIMAMKSAVELESAFAGIRKTIDATEEEFKALEQGILDMSKAGPTSAVELAKIAESAGQLGIAKEDILDFTATISDLAVSTNLTSEEAATSFARFANIMQMPTKEVGRLGAVVVDLGNNFATTESEIVNMAMRLAGVGNQIGLSEADVMALSAAMSSVGINAEAGGTAMSTVMKKIQNAVMDGGAELEGFAKVAGMSAEDFATAFENDPIRAIQSFVGGLGESGEAGENLNTILADLGIKGIRETDTLLRLSGAAGLLGDAVDTASTAWTENTALTDEAAKRYATMESQIEKFKNNLFALAADIGNVMAPTVMNLVEKLEKAVNWFSQLDDKAKKNIVIWGAIVAAIGPVLVVVGTLTAGLGSIIGFLGSAATAISIMGTTTAAATPLIGGLASAFTILTGPIGLGIAAVAGIVAGLVILDNHIKKDSIPAIDRFGDEVSDATKQALESFFELSDGAGQSLSDMRINNKVVTELMADELIAKYEDMNTAILEKMRARHTKELEEAESFFMNSSALTSEREDEILRQMEIRNKAKETTQQHYEDRIEQIVELAATERRALTENEYAQIDAIHKEMNENAVMYLTDNEKDQKIILERMTATASDLSARQAAEVVKNSAKQRDETIADAEKTYNDRVNWAITQRDETGAISEEEATAIIREAQKTYDQSVMYATDTHEEVVAEAKKQAKGHVDQVDWQTGEILSKWDVYKKGVIKRFHDTNKENLADFKRWGGNISDAWKKFDGDSKAWADSWRKGVRERFTGFFSDTRRDFRNFGDFVGGIFKDVANSMSRSLESGVNSVIKGVNWVLNKLGSSKKFGYWSAPRFGTTTSTDGRTKGNTLKYAHGTHDHPGGLALVGDGTGTNRGPELIEHPDGRQELSPERPTLMNLMKGARVWSATMTRKILGGVPKYAGGTLGAIHDWAAGKLGKVADIAGDVWNYIENPKGLLDLALKGLGIKAPSGSSAPMELAKAGFGQAKTAAVEFVKKQFSELMGGDGAFGGGGFVKGAGFPGMRKTSSYGFRIHPITKKASMHAGDDWGAPQGTPIPAQAPGVVVQSGYHSIRGNYVRVKTGAMERIYQHNVRNAVRVGDTVRKGQIVGYVGRTGRSTGPHLHYEVLRNGRNINPRGYKDGGIVDKAQLAWLAEGGWAESVISHDPAKRTTQKDIWRKTGEELGFANENGMTVEMIGLLERIARGVESPQDVAVIMDERKVGRMTSKHSQQEAESEKRRAQLFNPRGV